MSELRVASINNPSAGSGGLAISAAGNVTGAGLDLITTQSFSAVASISLDNVFSGDYDNYALVFRATGSTDAALALRFRTSSTDQTAANYDYQILKASSTTVSGARTTLSTSVDIGAVRTDPVEVYADIASPYASEQTGILTRERDASAGARYALTAGRYGATDSFDGFTVYPASGTMTGIVSVYGYKS